MSAWGAATCRDVEARLEALAGEAGHALPAAERAACLRHAERCAACRELLDLTRLGAPATAPGEDLVASVLAETSGPACEAALLRLAEVRASAPALGAGGELLALHLEGCNECRALAAVLRALAADLPRLVEVRPEPGFADEVLASTLPAGVRLRRWWARHGAVAAAGTWRRWVRRPRFAWEAAFLVTLAFLPLVAASGPTLAAAPARAVELAQEVPRAELEELGAEIDETLREIGRTEAGRRTGRGLGALRTTIGGAGAELATGFGEAAAAVGRSYGTLRTVAASFFAEGDEDGSSAASNETAPAPERPASEETTP